MEIKSWDNFKKLFESEDSDSVIPGGFKWSWNDIYESLFYLTDIGFEVIEDSKEMYLADELGNKIIGDWKGNFSRRRFTSNIDKAKNAIYEIKLFKKKSNGIIKRGNFYLDNDVDKLLSVYQEIASFCARFDKAYHNLTITESGYSVWLVVSSSVELDYINRVLQSEISEEIGEDIKDSLNSIFSRFGSKSYDKKFRQDFFNGLFVDLDGEIAFKIFNWNGVSGKVFNSNSDLFNSDVKRILQIFNSGEYIAGYKAEFREIKEDDLKKISKVDRDGESLSWMLDIVKENIGRKAIIITFDTNLITERLRRLGLPPFD